MKAWRVAAQVVADTTRDAAIRALECLALEYRAGDKTALLEAKDLYKISGAAALMNPETRRRVAINYAGRLKNELIAARRRKLEKIHNKG